MGLKRTKTDTSLESSPSESMDCVSELPYNKHFVEISTKLSLILDAINNLARVVREPNSGRAQAKTETAVSEISKVIKEIDERIKTNEAGGNSTNNINMQHFRNENYVEEEAMRVKNSIAGIWARKLDARKNAYWGYVRNQGDLNFHQRWIESNPIIIPRKLQRVEIKNENEDQKRLRERAVISDFRMELEMENLRIGSCRERAIKIEQEMEEIITSKCTGKVAEFLKELWQKNIKRNEEISHKRWQKNGTWLKSYEEDFVNKYKDSNPCFKQADTYRRNYYQAPQRSNAETNTYRRNHSQVPQRSYAEAVKFGPSNLNKRKDNGGDIKAILNQLVQQLETSQRPQFSPRPDFRQQRSHQRGGQRRGGWGSSNRHAQQNRGWSNYSNNSNNDDVVTPDSNSFQQADHNWNSRM